MNRVLFVWKWALVYYVYRVNFTFISLIRRIQVEMNKFQRCHYQHETLSEVFLEFFAVTPNEQKLKLRMEETVKNSEFCLFNQIWWLEKGRQLENWGKCLRFFVKIGQFSTLFVSEMTKIRRQNLQNPVFCGERRLPTCVWYAHILRWLNFINFI